MFTIFLSYFIIWEVLCLLYYDVDSDVLDMKEKIGTSEKNEKGKNIYMDSIVKGTNMKDKVVFARLACKAIAHDIPGIIFIGYLCTQNQYDSIGFALLGMLLGSFILRKFDFVSRETLELVDKIVTIVTLTLYFYIFIF